MAGILGFHHIAMKVKDFDRSVRFYTDTLGLSKSREWGSGGARAVMIDTGAGDYLELFEGGKGHTNDGAVLHFALRVDDCDGVLREVRETGAEITVESKNVDIPSSPAYPVRIAFFKGPDGETVELFQER